MNLTDQVNPGTKPSGQQALTISINEERAFYDSLRLIKNLDRVQSIKIRYHKPKIKKNTLIGAEHIFLEDSLRELRINCIEGPGNLNAFKKINELDVNALISQAKLMQRILKALNNKHYQDRHFAIRSSSEGEELKGRSEWIKLLKVESVGIIKRIYSEYSDYPFLERTVNSSGLDIGELKNTISSLNKIISNMMNHGDYVDNQLNCVLNKFGNMTDEIMPTKSEVDKENRKIQNIMEIVHHSEDKASKSGRFNKIEILDIHKMTVLIEIFCGEFSRIDFKIEKLKALKDSLELLRSAKIKLSYRNKTQF